MRSDTRKVDPWQTVCHPITRPARPKPFPVKTVLFAILCGLAVIVGGLWAVAS
jgi:hypothetical protein